MKESFNDVWDEIGEGKGLTYPSDYPEKRIDYIFYSNVNEKKNKIIIKPAIITVYRSGASDHLPVIAEFKVIKKKPEEDAQ